jgi:hypothetical protein
MSGWDGWRPAHSHPSLNSALPAGSRRVDCRFGIQSAAVAAGRPRRLGLFCGKMRGRGRGTGKICPGEEPPGMEVQPLARIHLIRCHGFAADQAAASSRIYEHLCLQPTAHVVPSRASIVRLQTETMPRMAPVHSRAALLCLLCALVCAWGQSCNEYAKPCQADSDCCGAMTCSLVSACKNGWACGRVRAGVCVRG